MYNINFFRSQLGQAAIASIAAMATFVVLSSHTPSSTLILVMRVSVISAHLGALRVQEACGGRTPDVAQTPVRPAEVKKRLEDTAPGPTQGVCKVAEDYHRMTILFSDICGFTAYSKTVEAEKVPRRARRARHLETLPNVLDSVRERWRRLPGSKAAPQGVQRPEHPSALPKTP